MRRELSFATVPCINYDVKRLLRNIQNKVQSQPNRLSCTAGSVAVGQSDCFVRFLLTAGGSTRWIPAPTGNSSCVATVCRSSDGGGTSSTDSTAGCGSTFSRSLSNSRHYAELNVMPSDSMPTLEPETHFSSRDAVQLELFG
jgi:hypothetical protein